MLNLYVTSSRKKYGKTFITAGLAATMQSLGYATGVYKPIQTSGIERGGFTQSPDLTYIKTLDPYINTAFTYLYKSSDEPLISSENENDYIDINIIHREYLRLSSSTDCTIIDGDSGILSPVAPNVQNIDIIKKLNVPVLIITEPHEDSINDTLMTIRVLETKEIPIRGVIINNIYDDCPKDLLVSLPRIIEEYTNVKILGLVPHIKVPAAPEDIITAILNGIDIESVFNVKIEKLEIS
ncbi:dethiobiotin synthase [bacterium]|nr:dethiobiotin synthase [bacterium]